MSRFSRAAYDPVKVDGDPSSSSLGAEAAYLRGTHSTSYGAKTAKDAEILGSARASSYGSTSTSMLSGLGSGAGAGAASSSDRSDRVKGMSMGGFGSSSAGGSAGSGLYATSWGARSSRFDDGGGLRLVGGGRGGVGGLCATHEYWCCGRVKRRRCQALLFLSLLVFIGTMIGIGYAAAPAFVKSRLAATKLTFTSLTISNPTSTVGLGVTDKDADPGSWSFTLGVNAVLSGLEPVDGSVAPFLATLRFAGVDVATLQMPQLNALAGVDNAVTIVAPVSVLSLSAFTTFGEALVNNDFVTADLVGVTSVSTTVGALTVQVNDVEFSKSVTFPGAGGLKQSTVTSFSLARSNSTTAIVDLVVSVFNPSITTISPLGDIAARIFYKGNDMGIATGTNVTLTQGLTTIALTGYLQSTNTSATEELISAYLGNREVIVSAKGEPAPSSFPLYAPILSALTLSARLEGTETPLLAGISVDSMYLVPVSDVAVGVRMNATVSVNNLLGGASPIYVKSVALNCSLEGEGQNLGDLFVPPTAVNNSVIPVGGGWSSGDSSGGGRVLSGKVRAVSSSSISSSRSSSSPDNALMAPPALPILNVTISVDAQLSIAESDTKFATFVLDFLRKDSLSLGLVSNASNSMTVAISCVLGDLEVSIPIVARTTVKGIGGFPYVAVDSFSVTGTVDPPAVPAILTALQVSILNPSPATFPLGANATLGLFVGTHRLGYSVLYNRTLVPGNNTLDLVGVIAPPPEALEATAALFSDYLGGRSSTVQVVGESVFMGEGLDTPAWLQAAVANISLGATLPGLDEATANSLLTNVTVQSLSLDFGEDGLSQSPTIGGAIRGVLQLPFSIPVSVGGTNASLDFVEDSTGIVMAHIELVNQSATWVPCSTQEACAHIQTPEDAASALAVLGASGAANALSPVGVLFLTIGPANMSVIDTLAFSRLITSAVKQKNVTLRLSGTASPLVTMAIGTLPIRGVRVNQTVSIPGMGNFEDPPIFVTSGDITNTSSTGVSLTVAFNIANPAPITGRLGPATLSIEYLGATFITSYIPCLILNQGLNTLSTEGVFELPDKNKDYPGYLAAKDALSRFLRGLSSDVVVYGIPGSSPNPLLAPALDTLVANASFPGMPDKLVQNGTLFLSFSDVPPQYSNAPATLTVTNVLGVDLSIVNASLTVYLCKDETNATDCASEDDYYAPIGYFYNGSLPDAPNGIVTVPAKTTLESKKYNITLLADATDDISIFADLAFYGDIVTKMKGNLTARLQKPAKDGQGPSDPFTETIFYEQASFRLFRADP